jgi:hypothetical protein
MLVELMLVQTLALKLSTNSIQMVMEQLKLVLVVD